MGGVAETRESFWTSWEGGKGFAKRQSMWDSFFIALSSRDDGIAGALLRWLFNVIFNFTIGLFGAAVHFMWTLWSLITSYGPGLFTGLVFFGVASLCAWSIVGLFLSTMYASAAGGLYGVAKIAHNQMRIEQQRRAALNQGHGQQRPHYQ